MSRKQVSKGVIRHGWWWWWWWWWSLYYLLIILILISCYIRHV